MDVALLGTPLDVHPQGCSLELLHHATRGGIGHAHEKGTAGSVGVGFRHALELEDEVFLGAVADLAVRALELARPVAAHVRVDAVAVAVTQADVERTVLLGLLGRARGVHLVADPNIGLGNGLALVVDDLPGHEPGLPQGDVQRLPNADRGQGPVLVAVGSDGQLHCCGVHPRQQERAPII